MNKQLPHCNKAAEQVHACPSAWGWGPYIVLWCMALLCSWAGLPGQAAAAQDPAHQHRVLVLGDSLSAEYGLQRGTGWVSLLTQKIQQQSIAAQVVNASISGETTSGGKARLQALLAQHRPTVVVIELGGNDALRGLPVDMTQNNLTAMVQAAQKSGAKVLLLGMQLPPNYGGDYARRFADTFGQVAKAEKVAWVPFFLQGIADGADPLVNFQADRIHPNEAAQSRMLANVWPKLYPLIRR